MYKAHILVESSQLTTSIWTHFEKNQKKSAEDVRLYEEMEAAEPGSWHRMKQLEKGLNPEDEDGKKFTVKYTFIFILRGVSGFYGNTPQNDRFTKKFPKIIVEDLVTHNQALKNQQEQQADHAVDLEDNMA